MVTTAGAGIISDSARTIYDIFDNPYSPATQLPSFAKERVLNDSGFILLREVRSAMACSAWLNCRVALMAPKTGRVSRPCWASRPPRRPSGCH